MTTILVIEDEATILESLIDILEVSQFVAIAADHGVLGLELAKQHKPDLILCDITMPILDGYGVLDELNQDPELSMIPFIFLTAKADRTDMRLGIKMGADDYLTKPISRVDLLDAIATQLKKRGIVENQIKLKLGALRQSISLSLPHEMRTPLNGILGFADILVEEHASISPAEILEMAQDIHICAEQLYRLIQNFLLYAELELIATDPEQIDALKREGTNGVESLIATISTQKATQSDRISDLNLQFQAELDRVTVCIGSNRLQKIVEEILDNAFKYSDRGMPVDVIVKYRDRNLDLDIIDRGRGMTTEQIANIGAHMQFERKLYEQEGSGLGLAIVLTIVQLHGGELSIESGSSNQSDNQSDNQTIIHITLPIS